MKNSNRSFSALMLLVLMVILASSILCVLGATTARVAYQEAQRQAEYSLGRQKCVNQANEYLAALQKELDQGKLSEDVYENSFTDGEGHCLTVVVEVADGKINVQNWESYTQREEEDKLGNLAMPGQEGNP